MPTLAEVQADNAQLSERANVLSRDLELARREFKRIQKAEQRAAAAEEARDAALALAESLQTERDVALRRVSALEGENQQLAARAAAFQRIRDALNV